jgi:replicative DNA helicase Mcm
MTTTAFDEAIRDFNQRVAKSLTVSQALRQHSGKVNVEGMIVAVSKLYKIVKEEAWTCPNCSNTDRKENKNPEYLPKAPKACGFCGYVGVLLPAHTLANAKTIELQDIEPENELDRLEAVLYEHDSANISAGETVRMSGNLRTAQRGNRLSIVLDVSYLKYTNKEELKVTAQDIEGFHRFAKRPDYMDKLTGMMFAPEVIGYKDAKKGILRAAVSRSQHGRSGQRLGTLLAGDPGTAKTQLLLAAAKLKMNSKQVTAQYATGKSITALIDKENGNTVMRLGPVALARDAICTINEIRTMSPDDQKYLIDVMQEEKFTVDKYGIIWPVLAPTTIIASTNPRGISWSEDDRISKDEIPLQKQLLDRFAQVYVFRDSDGEEDNREYANRKSEMENKRMPDYSRWFRKFVLYAERIEVTISPDADFMLREYWIKLKVKHLASRRTREALYNIARNQTRLYLKSEVDEAIAKEVMGDFSKILNDYGESVDVISNPRELAYQLCEAIIKTSKEPVALTDALTIACKQHDQVRYYIGNKLSVEENHKVRTIRDMLLDTSTLMVVKQKPLTLCKRASDTSDRSDSEPKQG